MYHSLLVVCLLIKMISTDEQQCSALNKKVNQYGIQITYPGKTFPGVRICQGLIQDSCCPQIYEDQIQNATAIELYHLLELYSIPLYEPLLRLTLQFNETITKLIELSRNETHSVLQRSYKSFYQFYRPSIDLFYNNFFRITSRTYQHELKNNLEELFRNILRITIELNDEEKLTPSSYFLCLWRHHPFGNRPNIIANRLEINLGKLFRLNELLKLSIELIQVMSTSVTTDYHCIDSYMQLAYCNFCSGRKELPCASNCANVIESCLVNVTLINDVWVNFIDSLENVAYFHGIEKVFSSLGLSISDALMTFFNSDEMQNKDIIDQCGATHIRREIFDNNQKFDDRFPNSILSSLLDQQVMSVRQSLEGYRSFWLILPKEICKINELAVSEEKICWTGTSITEDQRESTRFSYDKPLSLRLQWILKEMKEKSQLIGYKSRLSTSTNGNLLLINGLKLNLTDHFDNYSNDDELDYSDYAYEDSIDELTSSTTTFGSSTISVHDDISVDDLNTVSYYDYGDPDVYNDEFIETSTQQLFSLPTTTTIVRIPSYHQRPPIIWNINIDDSAQSTLSNSSSSINSPSLFLLFIFILT